jgi:hypothetical protein
MGVQYLVLWLEVETQKPPVDEGYGMDLFRQSTKEHPNGPSQPAQVLNSSELGAFLLLKLQETRSPGEEVTVNYAL